jgi:carbonic anhydrase/acetyltransferase-like protein (isoleucine patch superfamily)
MKTKLIVVAALVGWVSAGAAADDYDFYAGLRYPGAKLRPDVDIYKVKEAGTGDPKAYERREVDWWPRKGVDIIQVAKGMPLRTWTLRAPRLATGTHQLEAHLVGFRGMGNTMSGRSDGGPIEPGVVLRLPDGRKRCFVRGSFGEEDKKYIMDLYLKEMNRIKAGLDKTKRVKPSNADLRWPNNAKPGDPGTMQVESEHFIWVSGSQGGSDDDPWVNAKEPDRGKWYRDGAVECAEYWWALLEYAGNLMFYWDRKEKLKHEITVAGTKRNGHEVIAGYAGGGYGGCILKGAGGGPWASGLWHEWGHGSLLNRVRLGGGEAQADAHQCLADPSSLKGNAHIRAPWRNLFFGGGGYGHTIFYIITGDDPNWGYAWFTCLPYGADEWSVLQTVARVGEQRGLFKNGVRGVGDMVGEYGARLATFDCELEDLLTSHYFAPAHNWLETVDCAKGIYRIPWEDAPEPFGLNIVRLVPGDGAGKFTVDFMGLHDPDYFSDWRACIVAVGQDGQRRYSPMWNKGAMTMACQPGDRAYWLTVTATPTALYTGNSGQNLYTGRHAYRYPWSVQLSGARPGTPHDTRADPAETDLMKKGKRHPNGGGWVADSAKVAATAYIGPAARVLGNAQVLDHAMVEDYAVVTGDALVADHARVSGASMLDKRAKVIGHARTWAALGGSDVADIVPKRPGAEKLHEYALWANYAMDRPENTLLEDWYRFPHNAGIHSGPNLNGYLYGQPAFVVDGDHRGFRFDGKTQFGELCPRLADLGAITIDIIVKCEGQAAQTIFDFGSSITNCCVLKTARNGLPGLVATVDGKTVVSLIAPKPLPQNEWVRLRVEIDGIKAALWLNGNKIAEMPSNFRPCDVFPGGKEKRNFLAASRDGSGHFKGIIDRVVVYHAVHNDFSKVPEPLRDAPIRPTAEVAETFEKTLGNVAERNKQIQAGVQKMTEPYNKLKERQDARIKELLDRDPAYLAAIAELERVKKDSKGAADMAIKVGAAEKALGDASDKALAPYLPEKLWTGGFAYAGFRGYYNTPYRLYIADHVQTLVSGGPMREDPGSLKGLAETAASNKGWSTSIDWDWRMRQEVDGTIKDLPLQEKWLIKARGPVVTDHPARIK